MSPRSCIVCGALIGAAAVACGAFGAHGLKDLLEASGHAATWETGCRYAMYHALALVAVGAVGSARPGTAARLAPAAWALLVGTAVFSGCLLALSLTGIRWLGAIVPIGGAALIVGWLLFARVAASSDG
jgi:uncharacterized membrane protein YgdD (TMEM256/DUF423 family)